MDDSGDISDDTAIGVDASDVRSALLYLTAPEAGEYIAVMDVLEAAVDELTPRDLARELDRNGDSWDVTVVEARLDQLKRWRAVTSTTDTSDVRRYAELLARNWRYSATPVGRKVHRFYRDVLCEQSTAREIPIASLNASVLALERLATLVDTDTIDTSDVTEITRTINEVFVNQDHLDAALTGAAEALQGLAERFDLDDERTGELKTILVEYATRVAAELDSGAGRAIHALRQLRPHYGALADTFVAASDARLLIEQGALTGTRGSRADDWTALEKWFDLVNGRPARFSRRLVRALPGMHANLRRLHTSSGVATSRTRALQLAKACTTPDIGAQIAVAALGDHQWRKLHGTVELDDDSRVPSWLAAPPVDVPAVLQLTGRGGARGRAPAARDDTAARAETEQRRALASAAHAAAVTELVTATTGIPVSELAANLAVNALLEIASAAAVGGVRTATTDGVTCSVIAGDTTGPTVVSVTGWRVYTPGRICEFRRPGAPTALSPATTDPFDVQVVRTVGAHR